MEPMDAMEFILLLMEVPGIGDRTLAAILRRNAVARRSPEQFLHLSPAQWVEEYGMRRGAAARLASAARARRVEAEETARKLRRTGVSVLTLLDATYPARLLNELDDPPPVLFVYGNRSLLAAPLFAVANSNGASESALAASDSAASAALERGWFPVTGHNRVAYQRPALAAERSGRSVCYVLDRGLLEAFGGDLSRELFPAAHIWSTAYDPERDLTLSAFGLRDHGIAANNRRRDEIVFALADLIFAGEVRAGGQMERICLRALSQGKPVLLVGADAAGSARLCEAGARRMAASDSPALAAAMEQALLKDEG
jgi:predicted Rossmann fold nucleotide-binding protein DprA/Smf involved in DNA uptake